MGKFSGPGWILEFSRARSVYLYRFLLSEMNDLALLLHQAQAKGQSELYLQAYADLIFLNANQVYAKQNGSRLSGNNKQDQKP